MNNTLDIVLPVYRPATTTTARFRLLYGGSNAGKSTFVAQDLMDLAWQDGRQRILVVRKFKSTIRHSTHKLLRDVLAATGRLGRAKARDFDFTFPSGGEIIHSGLDDTQKLKSIAGITQIWFEEATEGAWPAGDEADLAQLDLRLRSVPPELCPQITLTFNPKKSAQRIFDYCGVPSSRLPNRDHVEIGEAYVQHTTWLDNPYAVEADLKTYRRLGGQMQAVYERGELVKVDAPDQLIQHTWVKAAFERDLSGAWTDGRRRLACDVARFGDDYTTIGYGMGYALEDAERVRGQDTTTTGRRVFTLAHERSIPAALVAVDTVGLGAGAADTARDLGLDVTEFKAGAKAVVVDLPDDDARPRLPDDIEFNNLRSQAWYWYRGLLRAGLVAYSQDLSDEVKRTLQEDLLAPRYRIGRERRLEVEPKQGTTRNWSIKRRLGRSPDMGDMEIMRCFGEFARVETPHPEILGTW